MNAILSTSYPLPTILQQPAFDRPCRRHQVGAFDLQESALDLFNSLLIRLGRQQAPLGRDQLATAARELCQDGTDAAVAPWIGQRMRRVAAAAMMVADPQWQAANDACEVARQVVDYVRGGDDLIPDRLPRIGRLDDAIVVETAWPQLDGEIGNYLDFRRIQRIEANLRGRNDFGFTRRDWEQASHAEQALAMLQRRVRESSYVSAPAALFRVH